MVKKSFAYFEKVYTRFAACALRYKLLCNSLRVVGSKLFRGIALFGEVYQRKYCCIEKVYIKLKSLFAACDECFFVEKMYRIISPPFCNQCKAFLPERDALCDTCLNTITPLVSTQIVLTKNKQIRVFCVGAYQEPLKNFILAKGRSEHLACYYMAQLIWQHSLFKHLEVDYIVPIPLHWRRYAKRGYNQSAEIAKWLSKWSGVPILHALKRVKATPFQSTYGKDERLANVIDAFQLNVTDAQKEQLRSKKIVLVDDVMTTGATLIAAGKALQQLKLAEICAAVLARTH